MYSHDGRHDAAFRVICIWYTAHMKAELYGASRHRSLTFLISKEHSAYSAVMLISFARNTELCWFSCSRLHWQLSYDCAFSSVFAYMRYGDLVILTFELLIWQILQYTVLYDCNIFTKFEGCLLNYWGLLLHFSELREASYSLYFQPFNNVWPRSDNVYHANLTCTVRKAYKLCSQMQATLPCLSSVDVASFWFVVWIVLFATCKAKCTAENWTQLNCSVQFSFPLCIEPATTCDDSATKSAVVAGSSQSGHICESANQRNVCRWTTPATSCDDRRRPSQVCRRPSPVLSVKNLRRPSPVVAARRRFNAQRKTELNSTERSSSVQFNWVQFSAVHWV